MKLAQFALGREFMARSADIIKLADRRKVARPAPDAFQLSLPLISVYLVVGFFFFMHLLRLSLTDTEHCSVA